MKYRVEFTQRALKDLKKLVHYVNEIDLGRRIDRYVFSNGTAPMEVYDWLRDKDFLLILVDMQ